MWFDGPFRKPGEVSPVVRERAREIVTRSFRLSRLAAKAKGLEPPAIGRLREVHVPTLIVLGEKDAPDIHAIARLIQEGVAGARVVIISQAGHCVPMEKPIEFNLAVEAFLATA